MLLNYYGIWRDIISDSRDIQGVIEGLQDRNFPFSHGRRANPDDFQFLKPDKRKLPIGVTVAELPPYVFKKDLQPNNPKPKTKKPQGFLGKLFESPPPKITKYSKQDSNLLLGANNLEDLIELVERCRFIVEDVDSIFRRFNMELRFQVILDGQAFSKRNEDEILDILKEQGATLDNIRVENAAIKAISNKKRAVEIRGETVNLFPLIFQAKIVPESPIVFGEKMPYWLVLGAKDKEELEGLIEHLGINFASLSETGQQEPKYHRKTLPKDVKVFVWRRDNGRCVECGSKEKLEFDHIIPVSKGGSNTARNIQLLCESCNRKKSNKIG